MDISRPKKKSSCLACRTNKRSCDGARPCGRCTKRGIPCVDVLDKRTKEFRKATAGASKESRAKTAVVTGLAAPPQQSVKSRGGRGLSSIGARQAANAAASLAATGGDNSSIDHMVASRGVDALAQAADVVTGKATGATKGIPAHRFASDSQGLRIGSAPVEKTIHSNSNSTARMEAERQVDVGRQTGVGTSNGAAPTGFRRTPGTSSTGDSAPLFQHPGMGGPASAAVAPELAAFGSPDDAAVLLASLTSMRHAGSTPAARHGAGGSGRGRGGEAASSNASYSSAGAGSGFGMPYAAASGASASTGFNHRHDPGRTGPRYYHAPGQVQPAVGQTHHPSIGLPSTQHVWPMAMAAGATATGIHPLQPHGPAGSRWPVLAPDSAGFRSGMLYQPNTSARHLASSSSSAHVIRNNSPAQWAAAGAAQGGSVPGFQHGSVLDLRQHDTPIGSASSASSSRIPGIERPAHAQTTEQAGRGSQLGPGRGGRGSPNRPPQSTRQRSIDVGLPRPWGATGTLLPSRKAASVQSGTGSLVRFGPARPPQQRGAEADALVAHRGARLPQHVLDLLEKSREANNEGKQDGKSDTQDEEEVAKGHASELQRVLAAIGRDSLAVSHGNRSSRSASGISIDVSRMGPYARLPSSLSCPPYVMQEDSMGSVQITCGRLPVAPSLAAMFGPDYNVNILVPPAIDQAVNSMLLPDGVSPSLPLAARGPGFYHDMFVKEARVLQELSRSPIAVMRTTLDPNSLQPQQAFINKAGISLLSPDVQLLEATQDHMWQLTVMNPVQVFLTSVENMAGMLQRKRQTTVKTQFLRFFFPDERCRSEVIRYTSLVKAGVSPRLAEDRAIKESEATASGSKSDGTGASSEYAGDSAASSTSSSSNGRIKVVRAHLVQQTDVQFQSGGDGAEKSRDSSPCDDEKTSQDREPATGRASDQGDFDGISTSDDGINMEPDPSSSDYDMPLFIAERIVCMPINSDLRVDIEWLGSVPRAVTMTTIPKSKVPELDDVRPELERRLAEMRFKQAQRRQTKAKGAPAARFDKQSVSSHGPQQAARPRSSGASRIVVPQEHNGYQRYHAVDSTGGAQHSAQQANREQKHGTADDQNDLDDDSLSFAGSGLTTAMSHSQDPQSTGLGVSSRRALVRASSQEQPLMDDDEGALQGAADSASDGGSVMSSASAALKRGASVGAGFLGGVPLIVHPDSIGARNEDGVGSQIYAGGASALSASVLSGTARRRRNGGILAPGGHHDRPGSRLSRADNGSIALSDCGGSLAHRPPSVRVGNSVGHVSVLDGEGLRDGACLSPAARDSSTGGSVGDLRSRLGSASVDSPRGRNPFRPSASSSSSSASAHAGGGSAAGGLDSGSGFIQDQRVVGPLEQPAVPPKLTPAELHRIDRPAGSATTYVEAPCLGVPYNGSTRLLGSNAQHGKLRPPALNSSATGLTGGVVASGSNASRSDAELGRRRRRESFESFGSNDDEAHHDGGPASKRARIERNPQSKAGGSSVQEPMLADASAQHGTQGGSRAAQAPSLLEISSGGRGQPDDGLDPDVQALLAPHDQGLTARKFYFYSEIASWRDEFITRLQRPGSKLGEELTRKIMQKSQRW